MKRVSRISPCRRNLPFRARMARGALALSFAAALMPAAQAAESLITNPAYALAQAETSPAQAAGEAELKALTEQVLKSLGAVTGAKDKEKTGQQAQPAAPGDYQALMNALTTLVEKATRQGKSSEDVFALIQEALANQDDRTLEALIARAGGKVELQKLLRALVQKAALQAAQPQDAYTRMLQAEGEATSVLEKAGSRAVASAGKQGGGAAAAPGRSIVVQPGDTLSIIALKVYGNVRKWRDIYEANRDRLNNPDLVPAGVRLRLP